MVFVVLRRACVDFRGLVCLGAGVKSSSLSSCLRDCEISSSSEDSTTIFLRDATLRVGLVGDSADIVAVITLVRAAKTGSNAGLVFFGCFEAILAAMRNFGHK